MDERCCHNIHYSIWFWFSYIIGVDETKADKLRSILAQLDYQQQIIAWEDKGVPFRSHIYVPEIHPVTECEFHEREDEGHVFKVKLTSFSHSRSLTLSPLSYTCTQANIICTVSLAHTHTHTWQRIGNSTRKGGPSKLQLDRFAEALYDESSKLTFPALTGQRKQSIRDVEILFSCDMERFMEKKGYEYEAKFISRIRNWRRACDERGLTELQRCKFNYELLEMILEELMPWYKEQYDFSLLEVNR